MKKLALLCSIFFLSACLAHPTLEPTPTTSAPFVIRQEENPYTPKPDDLSMRQAGVVLTSLDLSERSDLAPARAELHISGYMPNSCYELRIKVNPPNEAYQVFIEIYSIVDPSLKCEDVFQQFETSILLGEYSAGRYSVWVNDEFIGDMLSY